MGGTGQAGPWEQVAMVREAASSMERKAKISIVVPAYNEEAGISPVLDSIQSALQERNITDWEIIVVDDGSTDATRAAASRHGVKLLHHQKNRGYGAALKTGIRRAEGEIIVTIDADGTYPSGAIVTLLEHMDHYEMVVGARRGAKTVEPASRRLAKYLLGAFANYLSGTKIPDLNSGLRAFKREAVLPIISLLPSGFSFTSTLTLALICGGYDVHYVDIDYYKRVGRSKFKPVDAATFLSLIVRTITYFNPLKIATPVSLFLFFLGIAKLAYDLSLVFRFSNSAIMLLLFSVQIAVMGLLADAVARRR